MKLSLYSIAFITCTMLWFITTIIFAALFGWSYTRSQCTTRVQGLGPIKPFTDCSDRHFFAGYLSRICYDYDISSDAIKDRILRSCDGVTVETIDAGSFATMDFHNDRFRIWDDDKTCYNVIWG